MQTPQSILTLAGFDGPSFKSSDMQGNSLRGACPNCGGSRRLLIFIDHQTPNWNHQCDLCGYKNNKLDKLPVEYHGLSLGVVYEEEDADVLDTQINQLTESLVWLNYHQGMQEENREWYRNRGIPDEYQETWFLGYISKRSFLHEGSVYNSAAYTIPKVDSSNRVVNIDYRLMEFPEGAGKYRSEMSLPPAAFITKPQVTSGEKLFVVEGAFKAMVLHVFMESNGYEAQVIGLPSVGSKLYMNYAPSYRQCFIMLDPDSIVATKRVSEQLGRKARPVFSPVKIDEAINAGMSWKVFLKIIENSEL